MKQKEINKELRQEIENLKRQIRVMKFGYDPRGKSAYDLSQNP